MAQVQSDGSPIPETLSSRLCEAGAEIENKADKQMEELADDAVQEEENWDERCPICLSDIDDKAFLDNCFHSFCYFCVLQWSEMVQTCPLCKKSFKSIIHNVRSLDRYDQHFVEQKMNAKDKRQPLSRERFRYRTTMIGRRLRGNRVTHRQPRKAAAREQRKAVYSVNVWVTSPVVSSDGIVRVRDVSCAFFKANPAASHRLIPFLIREMRVLLGDDEEHVHFVVQLILSLIDKVDIGSEDFMRHLEPFLFERTSHFQHEFVTFAQSPFDLKAFDSRAQYNFPRTESAPVLLDDAPTSSATAAIRERLMAELSVETPWEGSPPLQQGTFYLSSGWETPPLIIIESSDENEQESPHRQMATNQPQQTSCEASIESESHLTAGNESPQNINHADISQSWDKKTKKERSKHRKRDRRDTYEYYKEKRVVKRTETDGRQTEERWCVSRRKESWSRRDSQQQSKNRKHSRDAKDPQWSPQVDEHVRGMPPVNYKLTEDSLQNPSKLPRLRSVIFVANRSDNKMQQMSRMDFQQSDPACVPAVQSSSQTEDPDSPTCEELEQELEAVESAIRVNKSQLLKVLQRIEDRKTASEILQCETPKL